MSTQFKLKSIIHLDMDAFYPSVEVLDNPTLKGRPVIVGGSKERGVVSSASYEARKFGVHSAQPMATAMRLCPQGIFLPVRMSRYKEVSRVIFKTFHLFTPLVEPVSIDEAFLDVTGSIRLFGQPEDIAKKIKKMVLKQTGLTVSAGVAPSKFVAKIASDLCKPDGLTVAPPGRVREFLAPLPVGRMWGVGEKTQDALNRLGIQTLGDLSRMPIRVLIKKFGTYGARMHHLSMGIDDTDVMPAHDVKSIGHEDTFPRDILEIDSARREILSLSNKVARRIRGEGLTARTITLKVKYSDLAQITRSTTLPKSTDDGLEIYSRACGLLERTDAGKKPIRLLGISLSQLGPLGSERQLSLFSQRDASERRRELNAVLDSLSEKFGEDSIRPATLFTK